MILQEITAEEFTEFEQDNRYGNIMQTVERARLREKMGFESYLLGVKNDAKVVGVGLLVIKNGEGWIQIGPVLDWEDVTIVDGFLDGVVKFARAKKINELEIFPPVLLSVRNRNGEKISEFNQERIFEVFRKYGFAHLGMTTEIEYKANRWMCVKDLSEIKDIEGARATYKKNVRGRLKNLGQDLKIEVLDDPKELKEWLRALESSNEKNGIKSRDLDYFKWIWEFFGEKVQFVVARKKDDNKIVAARVVFYRPNEVVTFVSGTIQEYKKLNGMTLLQDWQIAECLKRGIKRLNFYGLRGDFTEKNHLLEFKSGFGIEVEEYIGGFRKVLNPIGYYGGKVRRKIRGILSR